MSNSGEKVQYMDGMFICERCDFEYDILDTNEYLIPEPIYVYIELLSEYAIVDTHKREVYVRVDAIRKVQLITKLLNQHHSQKMIKKELDNYLDHE